jgi:hypothetical protein
VRLAQTTTDGTRIYLIPVANINAEHKLPATKACARLKQPHHPVVPGLFIQQVAAGGGGGGGIATAASIKRGFTLGTGYMEGRSAPGHATAYGLAPDGVSAVTLRYRRDRRWHSVTVPVRGNVFATTFPGHAGQAIRLYFHTRTGVHPVGPKPPSRAARRRQHELTRRSEARDVRATAQPEAFPPGGSAHTIFTVRMKVARPAHASLYTIQLRGPKPGECAKRYVFRSGVYPALAGKLRGLVKASFGFPRSQPGWCRGRYRGTVSLDINGSRRGGARGVVGRFDFVVR